MALAEDSDPFNPDNDGDGIPDEEDPEPDNPAVPGAPAPGAPTPTPDMTDPIQDSDGDGIPNSHDPNDDNDSIPDEEDPAPFDPTPVPTATVAPSPAPGGEAPGEPAAPVVDETPLVVALPVTGHAPQPKNPLSLPAALTLTSIGLLSWRLARRSLER